MIGETIPAETPEPERDVLDDLREWVEGGAIPLYVGKRALAEIERQRTLFSEMSVTASELRKSLEGMREILSVPL